MTLVVTFNTKFPVITLISIITIFLHSLHKICKKLKNEKMIKNKKAKSFILNGNFPS